MSVGFDPLACLVGLLAILLTIYTLWRSLSVILRVVDATCTMLADPNQGGGRSFWYFRLIIRNMGRPLHDVSVTLVFYEPGGPGLMRFPLRRFSPSDLNGTDSHAGEFAQGMVGEYGLKTYQMTSAEISGLRLLLKNPVAQQACFCVYSQGYLAKTLRVGAGIDLTKRRWNEAVRRIDPPHRVLVRSTSGRPKFLKTTIHLPRLVCLWPPLADFLRFAPLLARHQAENAKAAADSGHSPSPEPL